MPAKSIYITTHARFEMKRRRIKRSDVIATVRHPDQVVLSIKGRAIYQSKIAAGRMLLRVIVKEVRRCIMW